MNFVDFMDSTKSGMPAKSAKKENKKLTEKKTLALQRDPTVFSTLQQPGRAGRRGLPTWRTVGKMAATSTSHHWLAACHVTPHPTPLISSEGQGCMMYRPCSQLAVRGGATGNFLKGMAEPLHSACKARCWGSPRKLGKSLLMVQNDMQAFLQQW